MHGFLLPPSILLKPTPLLQVIPTPTYGLLDKAIPHNFVNISEVEVKDFRQTNP
jgi:hypothetical protein